MSSQLAVIPDVRFGRVEADGVEVFYREAGAADAPVVLLLHGFPASSFQFRELIPVSRIAIASSRPTCRDSALRMFQNSEDTFTPSTRSLRQSTSLYRHFISPSMYCCIFDFGAPTGLRLAVAHPERVTAIVSQNGNAYEEGFGAPWATLRKFWEDESNEIVRWSVSAEGAEGIRFQYFHEVLTPPLSRQSLTHSTLL